MVEVTRMPAGKVGADADSVAWEGTMGASSLSTTRREGAETDPEVSVEVEKGVDSEAGLEAHVGVEGADQPVALEVAHPSGQFDRRSS